MGLVKIKIENYKSINKSIINLKDINLLLGENGTGKSNIISAIIYFYNNLISRDEIDDIFDMNNLYNNRVEISLTFDMSRLRKYCNANIKNKNTNYQSYFERIVKYIDENEITITLVKIRDMRIKWSHNIEIRKIIANLFPIYNIDSREIDLINWDVLWKRIGDLTKVENDLKLELKNNMKELIEKKSVNMKKRLDGIQDIFDQLNIKLHSLKSNEYAAILSQIYFDGSEFNFKGGKLNNFSNGTNSYNYTCLLIYILRMLSQTKMKEPIIILDEPEISLHNNMIDNLTESFCQCSKDLTFIIATHSPRLVKNILIRDEGNFTIYQVYMLDKKTCVSKFKMFYTNKIREKVFITDQHASAYFAKAILLVEGETELELFNNKYLRILYECLNKFEIIKGMSDEVVYEIVSPHKRNCVIPTISLIDMDKVYSYRDNLNKKYFSLFEDKEKYYFRMKKDENPRTEIINLKQRIYKMAKSCKFHYEYPFFSSNDENYDTFVDNIQKYFQVYGIYVAKTTIEGMLITIENCDKVLMFLSKFEPKKFASIMPIYEILPNKNIKLNFLRLIFNGKSDFIFTYKQIIEKNKRLDNTIKEVIMKNRISKTAWVTEWLKYYFSSIISLDYNDKNLYYEFLEKMQDKATKKMVYKIFKRDFYELDFFLDIVNNRFV